MHAFNNYNKSAQDELSMGPLSIPEILKMEDEILPMLMMVAATDQDHELVQPEHTAIHDKRDTPSIMSLGDLSDNEGVVMPFMTETASAPENARQGTWKACRDCNQRHRKCLHNEYNTSSERVPTQSSHETAMAEFTAELEDRKPQMNEGPGVEQDIEDTELDELQQTEDPPNQQRVTVPETSRDDSPEAIDIALWTQRTSGPSNSHWRSSSPDSTQSNTSIPYNSKFTAESQNDRPISAGDTIIVKRDTTLGKHVPMEVRFWEGSEELHRLPANLYRQLNLACAKEQTNMPSCVKAKWPAPKTVYESGTNKATRFVHSLTKEDLLMARYHYGKMSQIIVVKQKSGNDINGGEAAIINYSRDASAAQGNSNSRPVNVWSIWDPLEELPSPQFVLRFMEPRSNELDDRHQPGLELKSSEQTPIRPENDQHDFESLNEGNTLKRPRTNAYDFGEVWPRRGRSGYIVVKRPSDGQTVRLICPECSRFDFETVTGLGSHLRSAHNLQISSNHEVTDACGVPTSQKIPTPKISKEIPGKYESRRSARASDTSNVAQEAAQVYATPAPSSAPTAHERGPVFVFKKSDLDLKPRVRPLKACNSADKLFVNALVAGVAKKDTLMLTVQVGDSEPMNIIRGDVEDYNSVLQAVEDAGSEDGLTITVTAEEIDV